MYHWRSTHTRSHWIRAHSRQIVRLISDKWKWKKKLRCTRAKKHLSKMFWLHFNLEINLAAVRLLSDIITFSLGSVLPKRSQWKKLPSTLKTQMKKVSLFLFIRQKWNGVWQRGKSGGFLLLLPLLLWSRSLLNGGDKTRKRVRRKPQNKRRTEI